MIRIGGLSKAFRTERTAIQAVRDVALDVEAHSFFTLLGPSGCGKTTILRCVAGLEEPDAGEIAIAGTTVYSSRRAVNVPPNRRRIGMVFQSYAVWPHMTVYANVAFPLEVRRQDGIRERVMRALAMVGLEETASRYATTLSGGQQQRVALARAVVAEPDVLLLDEPLSNLDAVLRSQMRAELRRLQETLKVTTMFVTHDQVEALSMSDRIAVVRDGRIVEAGTPGQLYDRPRDAFTAQFIGGGNILAGRIDDAGPDRPPGWCRLQTGFGTLVASGTGAARGGVRLFVRPEKVRLLAPGSGPDRGVNEFPCAITRRTFAGERIELEVRLADGTLLSARVSPDTASGLGTEARVGLDPHDISILEERPPDRPPGSQAG
jgi:iron(III) transport system ATP-binding protein